MDSLGTVLDKGVEEGDRDDEYDNKK